MRRAHRSLWVAFFLLTTIISMCAQQPTLAERPLQGLQLASLRPRQQLIWRRVSPAAGQIDGPVLYTLIIRSSATPNHIPRIASNYTLTNSLIGNDGTNVTIGGLSIDGNTGLVSFAGSQAFPGTGTVTSVAAGDLSITIGGTAAAPTVAVNGASVTNVDAAKLGGQPAANYARVDVSNTFAANQYFSAPVYAPIFYDSNNTGYYVDPNGTSALNVFRFNTADCLNGSCPANGAIRYTPNFHLNAPSGSAVIINWDNGTTPGANVAQLRVGNGQASDAFYITSGGTAFGSYVNTTDDSIGAGVTGVMVKQSNNYHRTANAAAVAAFVANAFPKGIDFDTSNADDGTFGVNQLLFGAPGTGEGIGSKRTAGGNQFGLDFYTNFTRKMFLTTAGVLTMAGGASCDGTTWNNASDRNLKTAFASISPAQVLQNLLSLPVQSWQYKSDSAGSRHIGPVAQDFHAAFAVGDDDRHISTVDEGGVALVAIQGLNQKLEEQLQKKDAQIAALQKERDAQQGQLAAVQEQMNAMMQRLKTVEKSVAGSRTQDKLLATKQ